MSTEQVREAYKAGQVWPEQEAAEEWWRKYEGELKFAVTQERLRQQQKVGALDEIIVGLRRSLDEQTVKINQLSDEIKQLQRLLVGFEHDASRALKELQLARPPTADPSGGDKALTRRR